MSWELADNLGYKPLTTFWEDFSIAERFGEGAIRDTAAFCFDEWKDDYKYLTELIMVINHKSWYWYERGNHNIMALYSDLYHEYDNKAINYLEGNEEAMNYYFRTLD